MLARGPFWRAFEYREENDPDVNPSGPGDRGLWWFSSSMEGRFDLPKPDGTCYLANDPEVCAREFLGLWAVNGSVPLSVVEGREVGEVSIETSPRLSNLCSSAASKVNGMSREISTSPDYDKTQAWAAHFAAEGREGLVYQPRHTMDPDHRSYALFGRNGEDRPAPHVVRDLIDVTREAGIEVESPPPLNSLTMA